MHRSLINFHTFASLFLTLSLCWLSPDIQAQTTARPIADWLESHRIGSNFEPVEGLLLPQADQNRSSRPAIENSSLLSLDRTTLNRLLEAAYPTMRLQIPNAYGTDFDLELVQVDILGEGFVVGTLGDQPKLSVDYQRGVHYRGIMRGNPNSVVAISLTTDGLMGMITDDTGTYTVGQMEDGSADYLLYRREDLPVSAPHACFTDEIEQHSDLQPTTGDRGVGCRTVQIYFECDYKIYTDKGSTTSGAANYVTSLFNQTAALYANENVSVAISEIYVWTSPDPYQSMGSTSSVLNAFRSNRGTNFNGNLAHFLSTRNLGGGIAYVDVICAKSYAFGVSGINTSFQNVPTYSWSVEVLTHELGHNLGSWHTQSCNWPGGALDNCVQTEGGCAPGPAPSNGGTIMSYCHLSSYGINFNNGFGTLPGNRIRDRVTAATCAPQVGSAPSNLSTSNVAATSATLNWGAVTGATSYSVQYKLASASAWTPAGTSTATSFNLSGLAASTAYNWQVKTDCSGFSPSANFTTTSGGGGSTCTAPTGLNSSGITTTSATVTWAAASGATGYTVQFKSSGATTWTTAGTTGNTNFSLSNLTASTAYQWQVKANCSGWSAMAAFTTSASGGGVTCVAPTGLVAGSITTTSVVLQWTASAGATSYTVQYKTAASVAWTTSPATTSLTRTLTGLTINTAYQWQVKANCSGYSATSNFTTLNTSGGTCPIPTGLSATNVSVNAATLKWSGVQGATSYTVQFKAGGSQFWSTAGTTTFLSYAVSGLSPGAPYDWRVKANCSSYSGTSTFTTVSSGGGGTTCAAPTDLTNQAIGSTWSVISWSAVPGAVSYTLQIKLTHETTYTTLGTVGSRQVALSGMQPNTAYMWRVKADCSFYSTSMLLTTTANLSDPGTAKLPQIAEFSVFPNPTTDVVQVQFSGPMLADAEIWVTDVTGHLMLRERMLLDQQQLDVSALPAGVYFLVLRQGGQQMGVQRVVKL